MLLVDVHIKEKSIILRFCPVLDTLDLLSFLRWSFVILLLLLYRLQRPSLSKLHLVLFYNSVGDELSKSINAANVTMFQ